MCPAPPAEPRLPPSGRPLQAAGLGGAQGPAMVPAPQEPGQTQHAHQVLREHVGPHALYIIFLHDAAPEGETRFLK